MKQKRQLALAVSLALLGGTSLVNQTAAADVATPSKTNELQAGNYVYVTNNINIGTTGDGSSGSVDNAKQTYTVKVGYTEENPATTDSLAINVPDDDNKVTGAMATGYGATASGLLANANGVKSFAYGNASLALGTEAQSYSSSSIAIGTDAHAGKTAGSDSSSGDAAIAIGLGSRANENLSIALGGNAQSESISSTAIGAFARTYGISSIALGAAAEAHDISDIAIGTGSYVDSSQGLKMSTGSMAIGYLAKTTGGQSVAVGSQSYATGDLAVALGTNTRASNVGAVAIGGAAISTSAWGTNSVGLGSGAGARGDYSTAVGSTALGIGYQSVATGFSAKAVGNGVAIGSKALVGSTRNSNAAAIGGIALGSDSLALTSYGVKGYDPLANAQVENMSDVLSGDTLTDYTDNKAAVDDARADLEAAEKAYKSNYSTFTDKVKKVEADTTLSDTERIAELTKLYNERADLAKKYNDAYTDLFIDEDNDTEGVYTYHVAAGTWEATGSALSIGNSDLGLTRQITGVAAGTEDTDAVNVAQLKRSRVTLVEGNNVTLENATTDSSTGMVYKVNALRTDVAVDNTLKLTKDTSTTATNGVTTYTVGLSETLTNTINNAADKGLTNISTDGKNVVKNLAKEAVAVTGANDYVTVDPDTTSDVNKTTYKVGLNLDNLKAGLAAGDNGLATKADVTGLSETVQKQIKSLTDNQLKESDVKEIAKDSIQVVNGVNTTVTEGVGENGAKTFAVNVSDDTIKGVVQPELDKKLNADGSNLNDTLVTKLKDQLGVNDAQQGLKDVNSRIDATNTLATEAHDRITETNNRVADVDTKVKTIDGKVTTIEGNVSNLTTNVNNISANVSTLNTNVDTLTTNVNTLTTDLGNLTNDVNTLSENVGAIASDVSSINNRVGKLDQRLDKVGASAAALAALHPLQFDEEDKFTVSAGVGNYKGEQAMALGAFFQANEDTLFSVGGTLGDENMVNLGVSLRFGSKGEGQRPSGPKAVRALTNEVESLQAKNATLENTVASQQDRLAQQEAELAAQRQLIEQLVAKVGL